MRLQNYIKELINPLVKYDATFKKAKFEKICRELYDDLHKDCGIYKDRVSGSSKLFLYRGYKGYNLAGLIDYQRKTVRSDRHPKDTPPHVQRAVDDVFQENWGWRPRQEGLFVTGDEKSARNYGLLYIVVPIGDFKFLWSYKIHDLFSKLVIDDDVSIKMEWEIEKYFESKYIDTYSSENLPKAIDTGVEIMLKCKEYYLIGNALEEIVQMWIENKPYKPLDFE